VKKNSKLSAQNLLEKVYDEVHSFTSDVPQMDDMTLVVIRKIA
jgi:serine phosphatase RsbU (regulator of sigma subunit)